MLSGLVCVFVCVCVCERMEGDKGDKVSKFTKLNRVYRYQASFLLCKIEIQFCRRALLLLLLLEESKCLTVEILGKQQSIYICTRAMLRLGPSSSGGGESGEWILVWEVTVGWVVREHSWNITKVRT